MRNYSPASLETLQTLSWKAEKVCPSARRETWVLVLVTRESLCTHVWTRSHLDFEMAYAASPKTWSSPYRRSDFIDSDVAAYKKLSTWHITPSLIPKSSTHKNTHVRTSCPSISVTNVKTE
ncbi:hypothetical protein CDEST_11334 [Colletotrichum destructivum]|uniref:Uncharacterized protein n=1 Tax=Colletotrichum destructivum TaxID=34406 RepID=A0AAX4ISS2_9PEZI|nr:hypothetical protein CDEST_11334 [Colletotrichum destructivum]